LRIFCRIASLNHVVAHEALFKHQKSLAEMSQWENQALLIILICKIVKGFAKEATGQAFKKDENRQK